MMIKMVMVAAVLAAGTATMAQAQDRGLAQGTQGRPHGGNFAEEMELRRHGLTRMQYHRMRMHQQRVRMKRVRHRI